jgi:fumarylpyruvate hydrolase
MNNGQAYPTLPIRGTSAAYTVKRIFCVGRNYAAHAREMGRDPDREPPFFFTKFPDAIAPNGAAVTYPPGTSNYQFEGELVLAIGKTGFRVPAEKANDYIYGYCVGLDMTRRDIQAKSKENAHPWDTAKNFEESAPMSALHLVADVGHLERGAIWLDVDGVRKQTGDLAEMIWTPAEVVAQLSLLYTIGPGDLIMTGTPAGVAAVMPGQSLRVHVDGLEDLNITIKPPRA